MSKVSNDEDTIYVMSILHSVIKCDIVVSYSKLFHRFNSNAHAQHTHWN